MKKFVLLHYGFEKPSPEMMKEWQKWFASVQDKTLANHGFGAGREISREGTKELPWGTDSITGCTILEAESLDHAEAIAKENPFVASIRIYEIREHSG